MWSVAAYKHIRSACAMLANNTCDVPVFFHLGTLHDLGRQQRREPTHRDTGLKSCRVSKSRMMYGVENTMMVRNIVLGSLSQQSGTSVESRPEQLDLPQPDMIDLCYLQPCQTIACARLWCSYDILAKHSYLDAPFLSQHVLRAEELGGRGRLLNEYDDVPRRL